MCVFVRDSVTGLLYPSCRTCLRLQEDTGRFFKGVERQGGGGLTYNEVGEKRNKCVAFDSSMTGRDWLDWEMSL